MSDQTERPTEEHDCEWCDHYEAHQTLAHTFCDDHQIAWCSICEQSVLCPECVFDPHCPSCHAPLNEENHDWDCPYAT